MKEIHETDVDIVSKAARRTNGSTLIWDTAYILCAAQLKFSTVLCKCIEANMLCIIKKVSDLR